MTPENRRAVEGRAVFVALLLLVGVLAFRNVSDRDFGIHMAGGRWILEHAAVPTTDPFTYPVSDHEYLAYHWLFQVVLYGTFSVAGERLFSQGNGPMPLTRKPRVMAQTPRTSRNRQPAPAASFRPAPKSMARPRQGRPAVSMASKGSNLHAYRD